MTETTESWEADPVVAGDGTDLSKQSSQLRLRRVENEVRRMSVSPFNVVSEARYKLVITDVAGSDTLLLHVPQKLP
jgi:hypothetical protein